ncbi:MAG: hypothetical protein ACTSUE_24740 [Promethearchaeota archaeon]
MWVLLLWVVAGLGFRTTRAATLTQESHDALIKVGADPTLVSQIESQLETEPPVLTPPEPSETVQVDWNNIVSLREYHSLKMEMPKRTKCESRVRRRGVTYARHFVSQTSKWFEMVEGKKFYYAPTTQEGLVKLVDTATFKNKCTVGIAGNSETKDVNIVLDYIR